jgi:RimJ/RimL family protein N-acetyltransferase
MDLPILETDRLRLRLFTMADLDRLASIYDDPEVMRFIGNGLPLSRDASQEKLAAMIYRWHTRRIPIWAVERKDSGEWIGRCGFSPYLDSDEIEITYTFRRPNWGHGFASEAARACLDYAREFSSWPRIIARSHPENIASRRVIEKLGFEFDRFEPEHRDGPSVFYVLPVAVTSCDD